MLRKDRVLEALRSLCAQRPAQSSVLRRYAGVMQPFTVPLGLSGFVATGGDLRGSLLQFFDLVVSALIYYPFLKAWERILVAREEAAAQPGESQTRTPVGVRLPSSLK